MNLLSGCLAVAATPIIGIVFLNVFMWLLFTYFPWAVFGLLIIVCIGVAAVRPRSWWY